VQVCLPTCLCVQRLQTASNSGSLGVWQSLARNLVSQSEDKLAVTNSDLAAPGEEAIESPARSESHVSIPEPVPARHVLTAPCRSIAMAAGSPGEESTVPVDRCLSFQEAASLSPSDGLWASCRCSLRRGPVRRWTPH
jgi:hypothetical protein